jgi:hypothetical protein
VIFFILFMAAGISTAMRSPSSLSLTRLAILPISGDGGDGWEHMGRSKAASTAPPCLLLLYFD